MPKGNGNEERFNREGQKIADVIAKRMSVNLSNGSFYLLFRLDDKLGRKDPGKTTSKPFLQLR